MHTEPFQAIEKLTDLLISRQEMLGDRDYMVEQIARIAQEVLEADLCVAFAINPITEQYYQPQVIGTLRDAASQTLLNQPRPAGVTKKVLTEGVVFIDDISKELDYQGDFTEAEGIRSFAALALRSNRYSKPFAVLYADYREFHSFSDVEKVAITLFAKQAALVMQNSWFLSRNHAVAQIGLEINEGLETPAKLFGKLWEHTQSILDTKHFLMLALFQPQTTTLELHMVENGELKAPSIVRLRGASEWVIRNQKSLRIDHHSQQGNPLPIEVAEIPGTVPDEESLLFVPLKLRDTVLGVLSIQHTQPYAYDSEDVHLLQLLANHVALAINGINLFTDLDQLNQTGQLLTQNLDSAGVLQRIAEQIHIVTKADVVSIYEYYSTIPKFNLPPHISGKLLVPNFPKPEVAWKDDIAALVVQQTQAIFAANSNELYTLLGGNATRRKGSFEQREGIASCAALPLLVGKECMGILFVNFRTLQHFAAPQRRLIEGLASYAAIAIRNTRLYGSLNQRRVQELELLQQIELAISQTLNLDAILQSLLHLTATHLQADEASILLYDRHAKRLDTRAAIGAFNTVSQGQQIAVDAQTSIARLAFVERQPILISDFETEATWQAMRLVVDPATRAEVDVPLLNEEGRSIGVMNFESRTPHAFSEDDVEFLRTVAAHAVLAIQNAQAHTREKSLIEISREIVGQLELQKTFEAILTKALDLTRSSFGVFMLYKSEQNEFNLVAERGVYEDKRQSRLAYGKGIISWLAEEWQRTGQLSITVDDVTKQPWLRYVENYIPNARSQLSTLLIENGSLRGVISVESPEVNAFSKRDEALLTAFAQLAVVALQNADLYTDAVIGKQRLRALHEIDRTIIAQLDNPDQVMRTIVSSALDLTGADVGELHLLHHGRFDSTYLARIDERGVIQPAELLTNAESRQLKRGIVSQVVTTKQTYRTTGDAQQDEHFTPGILNNSHSNIAVPLSNPDELVGVLNLESSKLGFFRESDTEILELLAGQAVIAIQNAEHYASAKRRQARFELLLEASQALAAITDLTQIEEAYDQVIDFAHRHHDERPCQVIVRRYEPEAQELVVVPLNAVDNSSSPPRLKLDKGVIAQVFREQTSQRIKNTKILSKSRDLKGVHSTTHSLLIAPISFEKNTYGTLTVSSSEIDYFYKTDLAFIDGLASQLALTIHRLEITRDRQEAEQRIVEAEMMGSIGESAYELTHRLGNDLGLVSSYVDEIETILTEVGTSVDTRLRTEFKNITEDVGRVLALSRALKVTLAKEKELSLSGGDKSPIAISALWQAVHRLLPPLPTHIQLEISLPQEDQLVNVNVSAIGSILTNLVSNAIDAMPTGGVIKLTTQIDENWVIIEVADNGPGIAKNTQTKIFHLFYSTKGTSGFGLWSARRHALHHQGDLKIISQLGQGATFQLFLPRMG